MNSRGASLMELLVAIVAATIVLLGIGTFYGFSARFSQQTSAHVSLQWQASLILDEMGRQIRSATALSSAQCSGGVVGVKVTNDRGGFCFWLNGNQLVEDRPNSGTFNLLSGSPAPLTVPAGGFTFVLSPGGCAAGPPTPCTSVNITTLRLQDSAAQSVTFSTVFTRRVT